MNGQTNIVAEKERYLDAWAEMMVTIWLDKMFLYNVGTSYTYSGKRRESTGYLESSFKAELDKQSGGDTYKVTHSFAYYGIYLDGGVFPGRGGIGENHRINHNRRLKPWRELSYGVSRRKLRDKMQELTGKDALYTIRTILLSGK